jgi:hypothetical protein
MESVSRSVCDLSEQLLGPKTAPIHSLRSECNFSVEDLRPSTMHRDPLRQEQYEALRLVVASRGCHPRPFERGLHHETFHTLWLHSIIYVTKMSPETECEALEAIKITSINPYVHSCCCVTE